MNKKICKGKCKRELEASSEFFYKAMGNADTFAGTCKDCFKKEQNIIKSKAKSRKKIEHHGSTTTWLNGDAEIYMGW